MKLRKLEMCGFKSFVDKTAIHFDHDVLGIVGPNGCGKSNIVDAIRWCMGEQSAKHLRGRSMEDVIFNGSESRSGSDFAEVTLTFDNDDPTDVPIEYKEYAEIAVTRRLHRNGDSEYLINKTHVRLKDITDLFLGTGVGTKAYSIIEQGKIGLIVSAKPEDRRMLIEEAAGITKYKSRKKQAEKKMELTQQNLLRVGDIVAEIERNLGSLKRQAAKAERYLSYRRELEDLQLYDASHRFLELAGWIKLESSEVERWAEEHERARGTLATREAELEGARFEALSVEEDLERAQNESFAAENEVRAEEAAIERGMDRIKSLREREAQGHVESQELTNEWERLESERHAFGADMADRETEEAQRAEQLAEADARLAELTTSLTTAEGEVQAVQQAQARAAADIASSEAKLAGFERRHAEMSTRLEKLSLEREELECVRIEHSARAKELAIEVDDLRTGKVTSAEERTRLETNLGELRTAIGTSERLLDEARAELQKKRSRLHALEEIAARLEGVGIGVKALLAGHDDALAGLVADRLEAPAELTAAVAGLLGARLQEVVVDDVERGVVLLEALADGKRGRATIVPRHPRFVAGAHCTLPEDEGIVSRLVDALRFAPEDEALVAALVGDAVVVRDTDAALRLKSGDLANVPLVTLSGTVFHPDGRVSGGCGEEVAAGMLETKRETRELGHEVERLDTLASERLAHHQALRGSIAETQGALERARHQAHKDELALVTVEKDLRAAESRIEQTTKRLEQLAAEVTDLTAALAEAQDERVAAERILDEARAIAEDCKGRFEATAAVAASWREQVDAGRSVVTEKKVLLAGVREKLTATRGALARLERSIGELAARRQRLEDDLVQNAQAFGEACATIVLHREKLSSALDVARVAQDKLAESRRAYDAMKAQLAEREGILKDLRAESEQTKEELSKHEMALRERSLAMEHLLGGVAEKFRGLHLPRVVGDYHLRPPPDDETRSRTHELASLLERMGSVNLDAMREHEEAEKRYAFYTEQKADLEKALADLERAIQQMNRESRRLFLDTFTAVNEKFQEIFPRMFRGGRASLRMTNPDDLLETGIDILAQPPGKKLASLELMSGGEKALTAVSLIFALFQFKPSPFCILDEVDAPLDEANVARYNEMVRSMTDRSQFILITHIKRTMQLVDVLYGVTMQESGVSRLVSVKINENAVEHAKRGEAAAAVA
jgi:chromosome segregation protein